MNSYNALSLIYKTGVSSLKLEKAISKDCYSYFYARDVLKDRFELGEESISKDSFCSWSYAINVMKRRFRLGEEAMGKNVCEYFIKVMGYMIMNSYNAYDLTLQTGVSNLELEKIISQDSHYSYFYAKTILKVRFELGEGVISEYGSHSYGYAINVIKGRFKLGEKQIVKNMKFSYFMYHFEYLVKVMGYNHE